MAIERTSIGVPSVHGITGALKSAAIGGVGALAVGLSKKFFGSGLIGGVAGIALAGSVLKGTSGEIVSTVLGYQLVNDLFGGTVSTGSAAVSNWITI